MSSTHVHTRPPLPPPHTYIVSSGDPCDSKLEQQQEIPVESNQTYTTPAGRTRRRQRINPIRIPFLARLLSKLDLASHSLQVGTETRYAYFTIFHRCLSHYIHHADQDSDVHVDFNTASVPAPRIPHRCVLTDAQRREISSLAAASIFLACKLCNQQRRIRDIINVKHMLQFDDDDDEKEGGHKKGSTLMVTSAPTSSSACSTKSGRIQFEPTPLNEEYWKQKEEMVRIEQTLLRIISFDVNLSYPHRILIVLWEELVSNWFNNEDDGGNNTTTHDIHRNTNMNGSRQDDLKVWKSILTAAWKTLNASVFHVDALMCKASSLACASLYWSIHLMKPRHSDSNGVGDNHVEAKVKQEHHDSKISIYDHVIKIEREWCEWFAVNEAEIEYAKEMLMEASNLKF